MIYTKCIKHKSEDDFSDCHGAREKRPKLNFTNLKWCRKKFLMQRAQNHVIPIRNKETALEWNFEILSTFSLKKCKRCFCTNLAAFPKCCRIAKRRWISMIFAPLERFPLLLWFVPILQQRHVSRNAPKLCKKVCKIWAKNKDRKFIQRQFRFLGCKMKVIWYATSIKSICNTH